MLFCRLTTRKSNLEHQIKNGKIKNGEVFQSKEFIEIKKAVMQTAFKTN
jgi:hypothetical protein